MKINLCKTFEVEEGEFFKLKGHRGKYRIINNDLLYSNSKEGIISEKSSLEINYIVKCEIVKLPKKFTDNELYILKNVDKKYKWIAKDKDGLICTFVSKPIKTEKLWSDGWSNSNNGASYASLEAIKNSLFTEIKWEDEEPIYIDDYVDR